VLPVLNHQRRDRWNLDHLMAQGIWILSLQQRATAAAGVRVVLDYLIHPLDRQQPRPSAGMALLPTALAATAFAALGRLVGEAFRAAVARAVTGGRLGGVAGGSTDPLAQAGQFRRQGCELRAELFILKSQALDLLLLPLKLIKNLKETSPHSHRGGGPVRF
jgi:hypothetical protein